MDQADLDFFAANGFLNMGQVFDGGDLQHFREMFATFYVAKYPDNSDPPHFENHSLRFTL